MKEHKRKPGQPLEEVAVRKKNIIQLNKRSNMNAQQGKDKTKASMFTLYNQNGEVLVSLLVLSSSNIANLHLQDLNFVPQNYQSLSRTVLLLNVQICECSKMPWNSPENCWDGKFHEYNLPTWFQYLTNILYKTSNGHLMI